MQTTSSEKLRGEESREERRFRLRKTPLRRDCQGNGSSDFSLRFFSILLPPDFFLYLLRTLFFMMRTIFTVLSFDLKPKTVPDQLTKTSLTLSLVLSIYFRLLK